MIGLVILLLIVLSVSFDFDLVKAEIQVPLFNQEQWPNVQYADNPNLTIASDGCALTSMAMILGFYGFKIDPPGLNDWMNQNDGFAYDSYTGYHDYVKWDVIPRFTNDKVTYVSNSSIDEELSKGFPVIAEVNHSSIPMHFVVIVGQENGDYIINDPLGGVRTTMSEQGYTIQEGKFYEGPLKPSAKIQIRAFNVDDIEEVFVDDQEVIREVFQEDSGWVDVSDKIQDETDFTIKVTNYSQGYAWGFEMKKNGKLIFRSRKGKAGIFGANDNDQTNENQVVFHQTYCLKGDNDALIWKGGFEVTSSYSPPPVVVESTGGCEKCFKSK